MTPTDLPTVTDLERLLATVSGAQRNYESHDNRFNSTPDAAALLEAAHHLVDQYRLLVAALRPRPVQVETGTAIGITVGGLDIHVHDDGDDRIAVCVNDDEAPADRCVYIESWDGVSWERPLHEESGR